jgi:hypothetical protein
MKEIIVDAPASSSGGAKSIKITNPDGSFALEENMLLYSGELPAPDSKGTMLHTVLNFGS